MDSSSAKETAKPPSPSLRFRSNGEMAFVVVVLAAYIVLFTSQGYEFQLP